MIQIQPELEVWSKHSPEAITLQQLDWKNLRVVAAVLGQSVALDYYARHACPASVPALAPPGARSSMTIFFAVELSPSITSTLARPAAKSPVTAHTYRLNILGCRHAGAWRACWRRSVT